MSGGRTYIISTEDAHDFTAAIQLHENTLLEVLLKVRLWYSNPARTTHLLELWLGLRHFGDRSLLVNLQGMIEASGICVGWLFVSSAVRMAGMRGARKQCRAYGTAF